MLLNVEQSSLLVVDIQERLLPAMYSGETVLKNTQTFLNFLKMQKSKFLRKFIFHVIAKQVYAKPLRLISNTSNWSFVV